MFSGKLSNLLRMWFWEFPQTFVGIVLVTYFIVRGLVNNIEISEGVLVVTAKGRWGGVSLGNYIIGSEQISPTVGNHLFMHEYGHSIQSRNVGPLYLLIFGIPSLASVLFRGSNHHESYVERYTNKLAYRYFKQKYSLDQWDISNYPIA